MISDDDSPILYHYEDTDFRISQEARYTGWIDRIAKHYDVEVKAINYILCSDSYILDINQRYLNHDYYTDIITFPYRQGRVLESDIYVSIDTVRSNAEERNLTEEDELLRVLAHGILHLIGYGDKTSEEQTVMRAEEELCIGLFKNF